MRTRIVILAATFGLLPGFADSSLVKLMNKSLGLSKEALIVGWGSYVTSADEEQVNIEAPRAYNFPGIPAVSTTRETGQIDSNGRYNGRSVTTTTPGREPHTYRWNDRIIYYLDSSGCAYRWEVRNAMEPDSNGKAIWAISDARELIRGKNGKPKIIKVGKFNGILR